MKLGLAVTASAVLVLPALLVATGPAVADTAPTCDGKAATMVVSQLPTTYDSDGDALAEGTAGDDVIVVSISGRLHVDGGAGDDTICATDSGAPFGAWLSGGDGNDTLVAGPDGNILDGGAGVNVLEGGPADDWFFDEAGDDTMTGGAGHDTLLLGTAQGPLYYSDSGPGPCPTVTGHPVVDVRASTVTGLGTDTFSGLELYNTGVYDAALLGSDGPDEFTTDEFCGTSVIDGRGGNDRITVENKGGSVSGGPGDDRIDVYSPYAVDGGRGDDVITLEPETSLWMSWAGSRVDGGAGRDWIDASYVAIVNLGRGVSEEGGRPWDATLTRVEDATVASPYADSGDARLVGTSGPNTFRVTDDRFEPTPTVIKGLGGNDRLLAGAHDTAVGGAGRDQCRAHLVRGCEIRHRLS